MAGGPDGTAGTAAVHMHCIGHSPAHYLFCGDSVPRNSPFWKTFGFMARRWHGIAFAPSIESRVLRVARRRQLVVVERLVLVENPTRGPAGKKPELLLSRAVGRRDVRDESQPVAG